MATTIAGLGIATNDYSEGTTAIGFRLALAAILKQQSPGVAAQGRMGDDHLTVAGSASAMSYTVSPGGLVIVRDTDKGAYIVGVPDPVTLETGTSDGVNPRIDRVYAFQPDPELDGEESDVDFVLDVAQGDPAATPVAPAIPSGAVELARKLIAPGATTTASGDEFTDVLPVTGLNLGATVTPVSNGGTGATSAAGARTALGVATAVNAVAAASATAADGVLLEGGTGGRINVGTPTSANNAVTKSYCDSNTSSFNGGTITNALTIESNFGVDGTGRIDGRFRNQYARDNVVTGWYNLGVAADGTIGQTASARRYKQHIENLEHTGDIDALRPRRFEWRSDKAPDIGLIAEEVADAGFSDLVTYNSEGTIMGVRHELLPVILLAEIQALRARVTELEAQ